MSKSVSGVFPSSQLENVTALHPFSIYTYSMYASRYFRPKYNLETIFKKLIQITDTHTYKPFIKFEGTPNLKIWHTKNEESCSVGY